MPEKMNITGRVTGAYGCLVLGGVGFADGVGEPF
jgi:hypothetical protein